MSALPVPKLEGSDATALATITMTSQAYIRTFSALTLKNRDRKAQSKFELLWLENLKATSKIRSVKIRHRKRNRLTNGDYISPGFARVLHNA